MCVGPCETHEPVPRKVFGSTGVPSRVVSTGGRGLDAQRLQLTQQLDHLVSQPHALDHLDVLDPAGTVPA